MDAAMSVTERIDVYTVLAYAKHLQTKASRPHIKHGLNKIFLASNKYL